MSLMLFPPQFFDLVFAPGGVGGLGGKIAHFPFFIYFDLRVNKILERGTNTN